jgi:hypothetical protein
MLDNIYRVNGMFKALSGLLERFQSRSLALPSPPAAIVPSAALGIAR